MRHVRGLWLRLFPGRREIILRANGRVRYLRIGRIGQLAGLAVVCLTIGGTVYITDRYLSHAEIVAARDARIAALKTAKDAVRNDLSTLRGALEAQETALATSERRSGELHGENASLRSEIARLSDEIEERARLREDLSLSHMQAVEKGDRLREEVRRLEARREELKHRLARAEAAVANVDAERERLHGEIAEMRDRLSGYETEVAALSSERGRLSSQLDTARARLRAAVEDRERVLSERETLDNQVADLSGRLAALEDAHFDVVARLGERARESAGPLRRALQIAGLDVERLLDRLSNGDDRESSGVGGPLVALGDEPGSGPGSGLAQQIAAVESRIDTLQGMQTLMEHLPLTPPLDEFRVTSGFGRRVDPFANTLALHPGLDLASRELAPVMVTAPGVVTFVGWKGGFGKMVEVDHGLGLRTRYAHLAKLFVKRGQTVEFREKVGLVGSTGRSTAPHLHYEILVDGRARDPASFMKAGQYVFKN